MASGSCRRGRSWLLVVAKHSRTRASYWIRYQVINALVQAQRNYESLGSHRYSKKANMYPIVNTHTHFFLLLFSA